MTIVVFLGPSLAIEDARKILDADYRPPIARGDLEMVPAGSVVAIIDGVFHHRNAVSPTEILDALAAGTRVLGSSSMGALRASEVPGMEGVGRVYAMFKSGELENDDEVALTFDAERFRPMSEPLVNIRHAVERLTSSGTLERSVGDKLLSIARRLYYPERTYPRILSEAGLAGQPQTALLQAMLESHDLKREDAISLLEQLARLGLTSARGSRPVDPNATPAAEPEAAPPDELAPIFFWEFGYSIPFDELVSFMKLTGTFASHARNAVARFVLEGNQLDESAFPSELADDEVEALAIHQFLQWDGRTKESRQVTLRDLGMTVEGVWDGVAAEAVANNVVMALARDGSPEFLRALRGELFANELALKRETVRCGSLSFFAARASSKAPTAGELAAARRVMCELVDAASWPHALALLGRWGVAGDQADAFAARLARARKAVPSGPEGRAAIGRIKRAHATKAAIHLVRLQRRTKHKGDRRFSLSMAQAAQHAERLRSTVQITRVSVISGLDRMGLPIAQAFRPGVGLWSNTVGGGKSTTVAGAKVGAVMEEVEKWAQEQFPQSARGPMLHGSYASLRRRHNIVDPALLELPYDSCYQPELPLDWCWLTDLLNERAILVPVAAVNARRSANDIFYSQHGGRKTTSTNGLASGFSLEEAVAHATSEVIERHAYTMASLITQNPGVSWAHGYRFVDLETVPRSTKRIVERIRRSGRRVRILDITSEVAVPTFLANMMVESEPWSERFGGAAGDNLGCAAYPDPEVAMNSALLEAAQTLAGSISGAREDLTLKVRSLGRHERTRCRTRASTRLLSGTTGEWQSFDSIAGFCSRDVKLDIEWIMERLRAAGAPHFLVLDLSVPEIRPARVVRVVLPGLETINPYYTGARGRAAMIRDLLTPDRSGSGA